MFGFELEMSFLPLKDRRHGPEIKDVKIHQIPFQMSLTHEKRSKEILKERGIGQQGQVNFQCKVLDLCTGR